MMPAQNNRPAMRGFLRIALVAAVCFSPVLAVAGFDHSAPRAAQAVRQSVLISRGAQATIRAGTITTSGTTVPERTETYGYSVQGRPLVSYVLGGGANKTIIFGGFHGNERSVPGVLNTLHRYLRQHPQQWPHCTVILVPDANPDGWAAGTRVNAKHIDINRNFPTRSWKPVGRTGRDNPGPYAGSEPETQAIIRLIKKYGPTKIISIHQPLHLLNWTGTPGKELAEVMQRANGYRTTDSIGYPTPGAFGDYCGEQSIALVTMELPNQNAAEAWTQNRAAFLAAIKVRL